MKVSIITVSFNSEKTIRSTIESVLNQSYSNIEYIIIDGKSVDGTVDIIQEYAPVFGQRLKWLSERDKGIYDAMNKGLRIATGEIVGILNSDDLYYDNEVVTDIIANFQSKQIDGIFGDLDFVKSENVNSIVRRWKGSEYSANAFIRGWHPAHPTFYALRDLYLKYGFFDISYKVSADFELMLRFIERYKIRTYYLNRTFVKMRMGGESTGSLQKIIIGNRNILRAFRENGIKISFLYLFYRLIPKAWNVLKLKVKFR